MAKSKGRKKQPVISKNGRYVARRPVGVMPNAALMAMAYPSGAEGRYPLVMPSVDVPFFLALNGGIQ